MTTLFDREKDDEEVLRPLDLAEHDLLEVSLDDKNADEFVVRARDSRGAGHVASHDARVKFAERFPERRKVQQQGVTVAHAVPCTDVSATVIRRSWPAERVTFSEDAALTYRYLLGTMAQQDAAMRRTALYHAWTKGGRQGPADFAPDFPMGGEKAAMLQQRVGMRNSLGVDAYCLFMQQGTGKTGVVIGRIDAESTAPDRPPGRLYRVLVVAPKNVRQNWANELGTFSTVDGHVAVARGQAHDRRMAIVQAMVPKRPTQRYVVVVVSYEVMSLSWDVIGAIPWDLGVLDESHSIKSPSAKRTKTALKLRDCCAARMCLTGTPVCNTPADLYTQLEFVRRGGSGFKSRDAFCDFYGVIKVADPRRGQKRLADVQHMPFLQERLARMAFIVSKAEALPDLPQKVYDVREVEMTAEQREIYDKVRDELYWELKDALEGGGSKGITVQNALTRLLRLGQITSGFLSLDPVVDLGTGEELAPRVVEEIAPNPKVESLSEMLRGGGDDEEEGLAPGEKAIVWCCWRPDILAVAARLEADGLSPVTYYGSTSDADRAEAERRFNFDPSCRVLVGNPGAGGTGLNLVGYDWPNNPRPSLDTNCTVVVYFSQDWSNPKRQQSEDRAHRKGTRVPVRYVDLTVAGTIDEEIRARVLDKKRTAMEVQDVRGILERVLGVSR